MRPTPAPPRCSGAGPGEFAAGEFDRLNREHFAGSIPPMPAIIGLTAYGGCIGLQRTSEDDAYADRLRAGLDRSGRRERQPGRTADHDQ